ncbi:MAG: phosphotransferase [Peptostreptococcus sp.]|uniref:phosphotransferase n=1 Tax=Peptostreptococcus sp. TaxID=1262 RepID=UPI002FCB96D0
MLSIDDVKKVVNTSQFIKNYAQGRNFPLNFYCYKVFVENLANGEYNFNYKINVLIKYEKKEIKESAVFRVNYGSQMNLSEQLEYEYNALLYLKETSITPKPIFLDRSKNLIDKDFLVMEYLEGKSMNYRTDLQLAAECLAHIHKYSKASEFDFIEPENPFEAILDECSSMYQKYIDSDLFNPLVNQKICCVFDKVEEILKEKKKLSENTLRIKKTLINTEVNSSNFIVNDDKCFLIDWEKPIIGEKEQDLGHFLAPTTTFWKTDTVFDKNEIDIFLYDYFLLYNEDLDKNINHREDIEFISFKRKVYDYITFNCLRGLTWCSMAWVEYNKNEKTLINEFTYKKLKDYLNLDFIDNIIDNFVNN